MIDIILGLLCLLVIVAGVAGLLYATLIRANQWNYPHAARGAGIFVLGMIVVAISTLAESDGAGNWAAYLNTAGFVACIVGALWHLYGLGQSPP